MAVGIRWRKAIALSVVMHMVLLASAGWLAGRLFAAREPAEQYVQLDLINEPAGAPGPVAGNAAQAAPVFAPAAVTPYSNREQTPPVVVPADSMSLVAAKPAMASPGAAGGGVWSGTGGGGTGGNGTGSGTGSGAGGKGAGRGSGGLVPPGILSQIEPVYPERARQSGLEGTVVLKIQIMENGLPGHVSVYSSSGHDILDDAAVTAVRQWRFIPARVRDTGRAVACYTTMPVTFRLRS
ncbi:MAG TPA: energy transducer TonB [Negativicutes bacterium]|nr:energy transducer TonB [Negativicutes bacterium]